MGGEEMGKIGIPSKMGSNGFQPRVCVEAIKSLISSHFLISRVIPVSCMQVGGIAIKVVPLLIYNDYRSVLSANEGENRRIYPTEYCPIGFHRMV